MYNAEQQQPIQGSTFASPLPPPFSHFGTLLNPNTLSLFSERQENTQIEESSSFPILDRPLLIADCVSHSRPSVIWALSPFRVISRRSERARDCAKRREQQLFKRQRNAGRKRFLFHFFVVLLSPAFLDPRHLCDSASDHIEKHSETANLPLIKNQILQDAKIRRECSI